MGEGSESYSSIVLKASWGLDLVSSQRMLADAGGAATLASKQQSRKKLTLVRPNDTLVGTQVMKFAMVDLALSIFGSPSLSDVEMWSARPLVCIVE